jgi:hypothetical protein
LHESRYILGTRGSQLGITLPSGAVFLSAALDGQTIIPQTRTNQLLQFNLPDVRPHALTLYWYFPPALEKIAQPRLEQPRLANTAATATLWTVLLPAGYELEPGTPQTVSTARADLSRAAAQLELLSHCFDSGDSSSPAGETLQQAEQNFYWYCRQAECKWSQADLSLEERAALMQQLQNLQDRNEELARKHKFTAIRLQAQKHLEAPAPLLCDSALPEGGIPRHWQTHAGAVPPRLRLISEASLQHRDDLYRSEVLLLALASLWIGSLIPGLVLLVRRTWPEQLLLLTMVLAQTLGWSVLGLCLVVLALSARLWLLVGAVQKWLSRRRSAEASGIGSSVVPARQ